MRKLLPLLLFWLSATVQAQSNINNLPAATTPLSSSDLFIVNQACAGNVNGCTRKVTAANVGAATTPGGNNTNVQINNAGAFFGSADFSWLTASDTLLIGTSALPPTIQPNTSTGAGVLMTLKGGTGAATSAGGAVVVTGASGGSTSGNGGAATFSSGSGGSTTTVTSGNGGTLNLTAGRGAFNTGSTAVTGTGGSINITAGLSAGCNFCASTTGDGGSVTIAAGSVDSANGDFGNGGSITLTGGNSFGTGGSPKAAGNISITAGSSPVGTDTPGGVSIFGGTSATCGSAEIGVGNIFSSLKFTGNSAGSCVTTWKLGAIGTTGNRLTGTNAGGVALGTATDCGAGCFAAQLLATTGYTVAGLPTCNAGIKGAFAYVTDATAPTYNAALTGGGAVIVPVFCNGTSWTSH